MPSALVQELAAEVGRIVSSPFSVSLKLLELLLKRSDNDAVRQWSEEHPCQRRQLSSIVLDVFQTWPYALDILERLSEANPTQREKFKEYSRLIGRAIGFRDAVLEHDPTLLHTLLIESTKSIQSYQKYGNVCCVLLSHPLPDTLPLPEITQTFVLHVVNHAIDSPGTEPFMQLLALIDGACAVLFNALPGEVLVRLEQSLLGVVKYERGGEFSGRNILCLALLAFLLGLDHSAVSSSGSSTFQVGLSPESLPCSSHRDLSATAQAFTGTKASKIAELIAFYVAFLCSDGCGSSPSEASASIQSIIVIARALPEEVRQEWIRVKAQVFRKVCEKALQTSTHPQVRSWTIVFINSLCGSGKMPQQILIAYESLLLDTIVLSMTPHEYRYLLQHTLEKMDLSLTSAFASTFLEQALSLVVNGNDSLVMLANFRTLAVAVVEIAQGSSSSRKDILLALCTNKLSPYLTTFLNFVPQIENKMDNCLRGDSFGRLLMKQRVELGALLCSTLLKLALLAQGDGDIGINPTMALALIDKQAMLNTVIASLTHRHPSFMPAKDSRSLLQQTSTPRALQENNNWKVLLSKELQRRAEDQEDMIIQSVAQACRDFEERCEDVESPLRLQEEKTAVLQRKYEDAQNSASELEV
ncbi:hypothetical protein EV356DRAFT_24586 [Viridothelium virens]|uniref:Uncharacterized protein n=1 Tax=Viridothelium virens TaxID=1048519 RepID=A0A6A6GTD9_VIRVR|nr:hypothetical protein EV356DRAFT_24586 [Viridothelium virens]